MRTNTSPGDLRFDPLLPAVAPPGPPSRPTPLAPWEISRYRDVATALRHPAVEAFFPASHVTTLCRTLGRDPGPLLHIMQLGPLSATGDKHRSVRAASRRILERTFMSWSADAIARLSHDLLTKASLRPTCQVHVDVMGPLTEAFTARELAVAADDLAVIRTEAGTLFRALFVMERRLRDMIPLVDCAERYHHAAERILRDTRAVHAITDVEPRDACLLFGLVTVPFTLALHASLTFLMVTLAQLPALGTLLRDQPAAIDRFIDECLRLSNGLRWTVKSITHEALELVDTTLAPASVFRCDLARANRDPDVFADPHLIDLMTPRLPHLAFGAGPHVCIGAQFSRLVLRSFLTVLLENFDVTTEAPTIEAHDPIRRAYARSEVTVRRRPGPGMTVPSGD